MIKIKCPHCCSVEKRKLDKDLYYCESCNSDYFLNYDDSNLNSSTEFIAEDRSHCAKNRALSIVLAFIIAIVIIAYLLIRLIASQVNGHSPRYYEIYTTSIITEIKASGELQLKSSINLLNDRQNNYISELFYITDNKLYSFE